MLLTKKSFFILLSVLLLGTAHAGTMTIVGGTTGDGDFEAAGSAAGAAQYVASPDWFNAQGAETINFTNTTQMGGSSQPNSRGGMPFQNRTQVNGTGYTIASAGEVFCLSYDFGAGGGLLAWNGGGDETLRTFLFTASIPVDGNLTTAEMTELGGDDYDIDRAGDGQWTTRSVPVFYTSTAADVGQTVYFGMQFLNDTGNDLFPRIDVVNLEVTPVPEPGTAAMLATMLVGLGMIRRK